MMRRLLACLARDLKVQYRARYVLTALLALVVWAAAMRMVSEAGAYVMAPAFLFLNTFLLSFSLGLRQATSEKHTGVLAALDASPLRPHEYLAARAVSLTLIAGAQNLALAIAGGKQIASYMALLGGVCSESILLSLFAFLVTAYTRPGNVVLARIVASGMLLVPPLLPFFGYAPGSWLILHPLQGPLVLLQGAFFRLPGTTVAMSLAGSAAWAMLLLAACRPAMGRVRREGC